MRGVASVGHGRALVLCAYVALALGFDATATQTTAQVTPAPTPAQTVTPPSIAAAGVAEPTAATALFLERLWLDAQKKRISRATFDAAFANFVPDPDVIGLNASQPEHLKSAGEYAALLVSPTRIANGQVQLANLGPTLAALEARFGVNRHILLAIWGMESAYGTSMGERRVVRSLATLAMADVRRSEFWRGELIAALSILERKDVTEDKLIGSWAGAMGHTQFIPSTYDAYAVDVDGDGRRDIWGTIVDGLGSTANYLKASGWITGTPWGFEVLLPASFDFSQSASNISKPMAEWQTLGLVTARADQVIPAGPLQLILPAGAKGPALLVTRNFSAILRYNRSVSYALSVGHLADRIEGAPPFTRGWPQDDKALSRGDREDLQRILQSKGYDIGEIDGILGTRTRLAIRSFQKTKGLIEDGHPNGALLAALREDASP
jgi:membrane-bound lytic murein transglycosylase B